MKRTGNLYATLTDSALQRQLSLSLKQLLRAGAGLILALITAGAADNLFNLSPLLRLLIVLCIAAAALTALIRVYLLYWRKRADPVKTAVYLEKRYAITDNRLVNAVCFDRDPEVAAPLKALFRQVADDTCKTFDRRRIWQHARLRPALRLFGICLLPAFVYLMAFRHHAMNAMQRYLNPTTAVTPLNYSQFAITPGDIELAEGSSCLIRAAATKFDRAAASLDILLEDGGSRPLLYNMSPRADNFAFEIKDLSRNTRYCIRHGNDRSRWFTITVMPRPRLDELQVTITPPAYTGAASWGFGAGKREAAVLEGSTIQVVPGSDSAGELRFYQDDRPVSVPEFVMTADTTLALDVRDARGLVHTGVWQCVFKLTRDRPPTVRFLNRELNIEVRSGQVVPVNLEAEDDFGLTALELFTVQNQSEIILKRLNYRRIRRVRNELSQFTVAADVFALNSSYRIWARVYDNQQPPRPGLVPVPLTIHVVDPAAASATTNAEDPHSRLFALLAEALDLQKRLRDQVAAQIDRERDQLANMLQRRQDIVHRHIANGAAMAVELQDRIRPELAAGIGNLAQSLSAPLIRQVQALAGLTGQRWREAVNEIVLRQSDIVSELQRLLGVINAHKAGEDLLEQRLAEEEQDQKLAEKLQALKEDLADFREERRRIMDDMEGIDRKNPEDWTEAEEKLLGDLAAGELQYAKIFQAAFNDLSKLHHQDFSNSTMADELIEIIEELQKAGAALEKKHIEIATVAEELAGALEESIAANLERWLADSKDHIKWVGEDGEDSPDVPLQDLPDELTDIIGDLIDAVEDMADVEDSSNASLNAMDDGIGWGVSDGNMDNMSAKGITGNIMPNDNEVGGRSGEGRSGKSSGQFVEKDASGKGGRDTPTRLVQSPFEKGTVNDSSKDPQGGATGGGKQSGVGGDGLRGITPDQQPELAQRLPGQQAELKQKAEALLRELTVRNLPTGDLEEAVNRMEMIQRYRASGQGLQLRQMQSELISSLKDAQTTIGAGIVAGGSEKSGSTDKLVPSIRHPNNENTPAGYEESVNAYFRVLAAPNL